MSNSIKLFFDENIAPSIMVDLRIAVNCEWAFVHFQERFVLGDKDQDWVGSLKDEPGWIVLTADRGSRSRKGDKLPDICVKHGITHILLDSQIHHMRGPQKLEALIQSWSNIVWVSESESGKGWLLTAELKPNGRTEFGVEPI